MAIIKTLYKPIKKESPVLQHLMEMDKKRLAKALQQFYNSYEKINYNNTGSDDSANSMPPHKDIYGR